MTMQGRPTLQRPLLPRSAHSTSRVFPPPVGPNDGGMSAPMDGARARRQRFLGAPRSHQSTAGRSRTMFAASSVSPRLQNFQSSFAARE